MTSRISMLWLVLATALLPADGVPREPWKTLLFEGETLSYRGFRIPALVVTRDQTLLAFCAARREMGDWDNIDIMMRRSTDRGRTWEPPRVIAQRPSMVVDNPSPIVDRQTGSIHFLYQVNYSQLNYIRSDDDGRTFSTPVDITAVMQSFRQGWVRTSTARRYGWTVMAPGPGHAIQLSSGRLLVTVWMSPSYTHRPSAIATIYSDDHGKTWQAGEIVPQTLVNPSEHVAVELADGRVMLNIRSEGNELRRAISISQDGVSGWSKPELVADLYDPVCMASLIRLSRQPQSDRNRLLFANPDGAAANNEKATNENNMRPRKNLTLRLSYDEGRTWPVSKLLEEGVTGYNDMAVGSDGSIYIVYEQVKGTGAATRRNLMFVRTSLEWLTGGRDHLPPVR